MMAFRDNCEYNCLIRCPYNIAGINILKEEIRVYESLYKLLQRKGFRRNREA